ncbi:MAG: hypothetical protein ACYS4W_15185 [Planctomycetota bacterium]
MRSQQAVLFVRRRLGNSPTEKVIYGVSSASSASPYRGFRKGPYVLFLGKGGAP